MQLSKRLKMEYCETSAKSALNVAEAFEQVSRRAANVSKQKLYIVASRSYRRKYNAINKFALVNRARIELRPRSSTCQC